MLCEFISTCPCEASDSNFTNDLTLLLGLLPNRLSPSPGQPSSHHPLTSRLPPSDPILLHAPILFYREKEGNVWAPCLLLGISSDGFNHPWVPSSSLPIPPFILLSAPSPHPLPSASSLSPEMLLLPCLFLSVPLSVRVSGECTSREIWAVPHRISRGPFFCTICLWWTWMSGLVCKLLSFGLKPIPLTWMHFYIAYIGICFQSFGLIMCQWCAVPNR